MHRLLRGGRVRHPSWARFHYLTFAAATRGPRRHRCSRCDERIVAASAEKFGGLARRFCFPTHLEIAVRVEGWATYPSARRAAAPPLVDWQTDRVNRTRAP